MMMRTTSTSNVRVKTCQHRAQQAALNRRKVAHAHAQATGLHNNTRKHTRKSNRNDAALWRIAAETEAEAEAEAMDTKQETLAPKIEVGPEFVPVCMLADLPKGTRKEVAVDSKPILLFWYRNEVYGIESKSTAEGYYSEGFIKAKFTQDYGIVCPSTATVFSIRDGSIVDWYPNNPVLRQLTPKDTCRPIEVYPVLISEDTVYINPTGSLEDWTPESGLRSDFTMPGQISSSKGGSDSSAEGNNVYGIEPKMYLEGTDASQPLDEFSPTSTTLTPATVIVGTIAAGIIAVAGTGVCLYYENFIALGVFWLVGISVVGLVAQKYANLDLD